MPAMQAKRMHDYRQSRHGGCPWWLLVVHCEREILRLKESGIGLAQCGWRWTLYVQSEWQEAQCAGCQGHGVP